MDSYDTFEQSYNRIKKKTSDKDILRDLSTMRDFFLSAYIAVDTLNHTIKILQEREIKKAEKQ
jgi:hypothetical protein